VVDTTVAADTATAGAALIPADPSFAAAPDSAVETAADTHAVTQVEATREAETVADSHAVEAEATPAVAEVVVTPTVAVAEATQAVAATADTAKSTNRR
jgi:hypothetical protein